MPPQPPSPPLERHLSDFLLRRLTSPRRSEGARARSLKRLREELYRTGPTPDEARAIDAGGRAGATQALALRVERALVAGAVELDELGEWRPTEVRVDPDADEVSTRGTAGPRDLLVLTRFASQRERTEREAQAGGAGTEDFAPSLHTLAMTYDETLAKEREDAWANDTIAAQLDAGATLVAVEEGGGTLAAEAGTVQLLALGDGFDPALAPVSEAMLGVVTPVRGSRALGTSTTSVDVGDVLDGKYELVEKLGQGGFGAVYRAIDRDLDTEVAVKLLRAELASQESALEEFRAEARRVAKLEHSNIVGWKGFNAGSDAGPYFVMEFLRGTELVNVVREEGALPLDRARRILHQVLQALVAAHYPASGEQVLHLDLKPQNIFLTQAPDGSEAAKVIDFGIGKLTGRSAEKRGSAEPSLEQHPHATLPGATLSLATRGPAAGSPGTGGQSTTASVACTPEYASPEQARNMLAQAEVAALDDRSDLYSFGVVAFELLTGDLPFERLPREARIEYLDLHRETPPRRVRDLRSDVDRRLSEFVESCLAKAPDDRFESSREALAEFEALLAAKRNSALIAVASVAGVLIATLVLLLAFGGQTHSLPLEVASVVDGEARPLGETLWIAAGQTLPLTIPLDGTDERPELAPIAGGSETLSGWSLEALAGNSRTFLLRAPQVEGAARVWARIVADTSEGRRESDEIQLVALGSEAVVLEAIRIGSVALDADQRQRLSLSGQVLAVDLVANAADVTRVDVGTDALGWRSFDGPVELDGILRWTFGLEGLHLPEGPHALELRVVDATGSERGARTRLDLDVFPKRPQAPSVDFSRVPTVGGRLQFDPDAALALEVRGEPAVTVEFEVDRRVDERLPELAVTLDQAGIGQVVLWDRLVRTADGAPLDRHDGTLRVRSRHGADVQHADARDGVSEWYPFEYRYEPERPSIVPSLPEARRLPSGAFAVEGASTKLLLRPENSAACRVTVTVRRGDGEPVGPVPVELEAIDQAGELLDIALPEDGTYAIEVVVRRPGSPDESDGQPPSWASEDLAVVRLSAPPRVRFGLEGETAAPGIPVVRAGESLPEPRIELAAPALVDIACTVAIGDLRWTGQVAEGETRARLALPEGVTTEALPDGAYRARFEVADPFGRPWRGLDGAAVDDRSTGLVLARRPPRAEVELLVEGGEWDSGVNGVFPVTVSIEDGNDVDLTSAALSLAAPERPALGTRRVPLDRSSGGAYRGTFELGHLWSGAWVELAVSVADPYGNRLEAPLLERIQLAHVERALEKRIRIAAPVDGAVATTRMVLARGPEERASFVFGAPVGRQRDAIDVRIDPESFGAYYLDEHEVTAEQYLAFLLDPSGYMDAGHWPALPPGEDPWIPAEGRRVELVELAGSLPRRAPMIEVQWAEACAYARYVGKRLQSELEWQWAVRGGSVGRAWSADGRMDWPDVALQSRVDGTFDVDDYLDVTPEGLRGLCSGADEWTATPAWFDGGGPRPAGSRRERIEADGNLAAFTKPWSHTFDRDHIVVRGGDPNTDSPPLYHWHSVKSSRFTNRSKNLGFRCSLAFEEYERLFAQGRARPDRRTDVGTVEADAPR